MTRQLALPLALIVFFAAYCIDETCLVDDCVADDWAQWRGANRDGVWKETGLVKKFESKQIEIKWRMPIGSGYSGPTVAKRRVYVTDRQVVTDGNVAPKQTERVHCFDSETGQKVWMHEYDCAYTISYQAGPRACVTVDDNRAFALGAMGHLHCLDAGTGTVLWKRDLNKDFKIRMPIWGIAAAPLIYDDLVILHIGGTDGACIVALDKKSGEEEWRALKDVASYSAPIVIQQAGKDVVVCWTGSSVAGLDPDKGTVHWRFPFPARKMPIGIATPVLSNNRLFMTSFYDGALMLKIDPDRLQVDKMWQRNGESERNTDALQSIISTPLFLGDHVYGCDSYGELRCLDSATGDRLWTDQTATPRDRWSNIHFVQNGDTSWLFNERGELIIAKLSPRGFEEISRAKLLEPTLEQLRRRNGVCWAHPAFADQHVFARNDKEIVCASLED
ncbi:MAG: outer membrane protein assembly factor BamB [Pirellulaceae bacterium]|jgi:outer membrane protein assembly factor BamB